MVYRNNCTHLTSWKRTSKQKLQSFERRNSSPWQWTAWNVVGNVWMWSEGTFNMLQICDTDYFYVRHPVLSLYILTDKDQWLQRLRSRWSLANKHKDGVVNNAACRMNSSVFRHITTRPGWVIRRACPLLAPALNTKQITNIFAKGTRRNLFVCIPPL
jgi:hypothetical protein